MKIIAFIWDERAWFFKPDSKYVTADDYMHSELSEQLFGMHVKDCLSLHLTETPQVVILKSSNA